MRVIWLVAALVLGFAGFMILGSLFAGSASAQGRVVVEYTARIGPDDHFNSHGDRLETVAAILRQDRANMHRFDMPDDEDQSDDYFTDPETRGLFEWLVSRGLTRADTRRAIISGNPLVRVTVYQRRADVEIVEP
jgi:hypothetical protein